MLVVGVDPGPRVCHYAIMRFGELKEMVTCGEFTADVDSVAEFGHTVCDQLAPSGLSCVGIERPMWMGNGAAVNNLLGTATAIGMVKQTLGLARSRNDRWHVYDFTSVEWRKKIVGKGNAKDAQIKEAIRTIMPNLPAGLNEHKYDAIGVAMNALLLEQKRGAV